MKQNQCNHLKLFGLKFLTAIFFLLLTMQFSAIAQNTAITLEVERKADYFERIYFCGENHAGINSLYRRSLQELEGKNLSPAATQQYDYLVALQENVTNASNACDALEIIGAAIHEMDEAVAAKLQIPQPTIKAKGNVLNTLSSAVAAKTDSSSRIGRKNAQVQDATETVNLIKSFLPPKKDKPCKKIVARLVEIGYHPTASEAAKNEIKEINGKKYHTQSHITINNISFSQLTDIKAQLKKKEGIVEIKNGEYKNNIVVLDIMHNLQVDDVVNLILNQKKQYKVEVESISGDDGVLVINK